MTFITIFSFDKNRVQVLEVRTENLKSQRSRAEQFSSGKKRQFAIQKRHFGVRKRHFGVRKRHKAV